MGFKRATKNWQCLSWKQICRTFWKDNINQLTDTVPSLLIPLLNSMAETVKMSHLKSIKQGFSEVERTQSHKAKSFVLLRTNEDLILPDTCLASFREGGVKPVSMKDDHSIEVIAPLASRAYLYGFKKRPHKRDIKTLRSALSSCSFEFFLAATDQREIRKFQSKISKNAQLTSAQEVKRLLSPKTFSSII